MIPEKYYPAILFTYTDANKIIARVNAYRDNRIRNTIPVRCDLMR